MDIRGVRPAEESDQLADFFGFAGTAERDRGHDGIADRAPDRGLRRWTAVADHGADDLSSCGPGALQGLSCFNALASDDEDPSDNRKARTGPRMVAQ